MILYYLGKNFYMRISLKSNIKRYHAKKRFFLQKQSRQENRDGITLIRSGFKTSPQSALTLNLIEDFETTSIHFLHTLRLYDDRTDRKNNSERDHFRKFCIFSLILFSFFCNFYNVL